MQMAEKTLRHKEKLIHAAWYGFILAVLFLICKYVLPLLAPFLIGFAIAFIFKPLYLWVARKTHLSEKFCGTVVIFLVYAALVLLLWFLGGRLLELIQYIALHAQEYYDGYIAPLLAQFNAMTVQTVSSVTPSLAPQANDLLSSFAANLQSYLVELSGKALSYVASIGMKIPGFLFNLVFAIMASIFISMDYHNVVSFLVKLLPKRYQGVAFETKDIFVGTICKYLRAYLILMVITFAELSVGLLVIGVQYAVVIAAATAICDALPVLGTGIILLPWAFFELLQGNFGMALGILILYIVVGIIRNFIEPKVLGKQLGLHPLATLLAVYLGLKAFGVLGMIFFPILLQILVSLQKSGSLKLWTGSELDAKT